MGPRKNLLASRRRVEDDGEEEGGPETVELEDDSMTETSVHSEEDDDDIDGSDTSEVVGEDVNGIGAVTTNGRVKAVNGTGPKVSSVLHDPLTCVGGDTEAMMNGLRISGDQLAAEEIDFEDMTEDMGASTQDVQGQPEVLKNETPFEKRRREHEEYKKRRDADPAFVPNRGAFFMHDHRHAGPAANGFRPFGRGRGRGRGGAIGGPYSPAK
jgi:CASC3/Barentsz eIF4AIII binding